MTFLENIPNDETLDFKLMPSNTIEENQIIHGYVTVIKNAGKDDEQVLCKNKHNLLTNAGRDYFHAQCYTNTSAGGIGCNYIALSENSGGAAAGHTAVAGEISTSGLARAQASTRTHTSGTNTNLTQIDVCADNINALNTVATNAEGNAISMSIALG